MTAGNRGQKKQPTRERQTERDHWRKRSMARPFVVHVQHEHMLEQKAPRPAGALARLERIGLRPGVTCWSVVVFRESVVRTPGILILAYGLCFVRPHPFCTSSSLSLCFYFAIVCITDRRCPLEDTADGTLKQFHF